MPDRAPGSLAGALATTLALSAPARPGQASGTLCTTDNGRFRSDQASGHITCAIPFTAGFRGHFAIDCKFPHLRQASFDSPRAIQPPNQPLRRHIDDPVVVDGGIKKVWLKDDPEEWFETFASAVSR